jgi:hypothetical protein
MIDSFDLIAVLKQVCRSEKCEYVTIQDIVKSNKYKKHYIMDDGKFNFPNASINVCLEMLLNEGFVFKVDGYFYPSVRGLSFIESFSYSDLEDLEDCPILLLEKQALAKCESDYFGE